MTKVADPIPPGSPTRLTETRTTAFAYDPTTGLLSKEIANAGNHRAVTTTYQRDTYGNIITTFVSAQGEKTQITKTEYDPFGRYIFALINSLGHRTTKSALPTNGLPISVTDPNGLTTQFEYDSFGRLTRELSPSGIVSSTELLTPGHISDVGALNGLKVAYASRRQTDTLPETLSLFDKKGRVLRTVTDGFTADGVTKRPIQVDTIYDLVGRVERTSLPYERGRSIYWRSNHYDVLGRVDSAKAPDGLVTETHYAGLTAGGAKSHRNRGSWPSQSTLNLANQHEETYR